MSRFQCWPECSRRLHRIVDVSIALLIAATVQAVSARAVGAEPPFQMFDHGHTAVVRYVAGSPAPVRNAAAMLARDMRDVAGANSTPHVNVGSWHASGKDKTLGSGNGVIIGLASAPGMSALLHRNGISVEAIQGKWEAYGRAVIAAPWNGRKKALIIFGSDPLGVVWGVVDLSRSMGVSAWNWWADVPISHRTKFDVSSSVFYSNAPSVKYRGIFLNSFGLINWVKTKTGAGLTASTYKRICELLWRLKANVIWPIGGFNHIPGAYKVLQDYGILRGSDHITFLLRNAAQSWNTKTMGPYDWFTNSKRMVTYWKKGPERYGKFYNMYSVGLRGANDFPMEGAGSLEHEATAITEAINAQEGALSSALGKPACSVP